KGLSAAAAGRDNANGRRRVGYGTHATTTGPLGAALPARGSSVTSRLSGRAASVGSSAMRRALPPASGSTVPSEVHVAPCRTHAWYVCPAGAGGKCEKVTTAVATPGRPR